MYARTYNMTVILNLKKILFSYCMIWMVVGTMRTFILSFSCPARRPVRPTKNSMKRSPFYNPFLTMTCQMYKKFNEKVSIVQFYFFNYDISDSKLSNPIHLMDKQEKQTDSLIVTLKTYVATYTRTKSVNKIIFTLNLRQMNKQSKFERWDRRSRNYTQEFVLRHLPSGQCAQPVSFKILVFHFKRYKCTACR